MIYPVCLLFLYFLYFFVIVRTVVVRAMKNLQYNPYLWPNCRRHLLARVSHTKCSYSYNTPHTYHSPRSRRPTAAAAAADDDDDDFQ